MGNVAHKHESSVPKTSVSALSTPLTERVLRKGKRTWKPLKAPKGSPSYLLGAEGGKRSKKPKGRSEGSREAHTIQPQRQMGMESAREPHQPQRQALGSGDLPRSLMPPPSIRVSLDPTLFNSRRKKNPPKPYTQEAHLELSLEMQKTQNYL